MIVGPHTFNFAQATEDAIASGAALRLDGPQAIANALLTFWLDEKKPQMQAAALAFSAAHRGATERTLVVIQEQVLTET